MLTDLVFTTKPSWKTIGYCKGCQKPCFLNDGEKHWEVGVMCQCEARLNRGHPVFNLKKIGFTFLLVLAVIMTNDGFLRLLELALLSIAVAMTIWHLEGWLVVKLSEGHHPMQYDIRVVYKIDPDTNKLVDIYNCDYRNGKEYGFDPESD